MLVFNEKQFNEVNFCGMSMRRIILNNDSVWAKQYDLSIVKSDQSISLPDGYLQWTTKTDPSSGCDTTKCHYGEVIETVFCDNGVNKVALPTGTYNVRRDTTIPATLIRFSAAADCDVEIDGSEFHLSIPNPYDLPLNQIYRIPEDYTSSYRFIVQWLRCDPYGNYSVGDVDDLNEWESHGYTYSTTGGFVISHDKLADAPAELKYCIVNWFSQIREIFVRCTQVIEIEGVAAIRQNYSSDEAHTVFDNNTGLIPDIWGPTNVDPSWR